LGGPPDDEDYAADYTNHSCDPNLWMKDEATLMARRDIEAGEELTADYMVWEVDEDYRAAWECKCEVVGELATWQACSNRLGRPTEHGAKRMVISNVPTLRKRWR